jgi:hypothetical protein
MFGLPPDIGIKAAGISDRSFFGASKLLKAWLRMDKRNKEISK